ncbi:two component transcriptional regulator, winged helix family [Acidothermus cellulolyticus 11B]|uniref:Two component transcriptional regulator, winged helix family n=2 Tax=Acidothermus cellulolyticus TaxID=28049 RepID=A0LVZ4_ACIC1|nr:two component transcriptional regulator, winged helix family [Acidothermus cellulolyticus 11B]
MIRGGRSGGGAPWHSGSVPRILLIEDDDRIRASMRLALTDDGHEVIEAPSGAAGLELFGAGGADVVLVDLMLPDIDGFECCRRLRRSSDVPIIMVTARTDTHDVVAGLEAGADDYVTKPFEMKELSARIRALLRRSRSAGGPAGEVIDIQDLEIRPDAGVVRRNGEALHLTRTEFRLLCELASAPDRVYSREQLLERVWGYDYFGDGRIVDVHVRRLRTKIEEDPAHPRILVTVRGLGYKIQPAP